MAEASSWSFMTPKSSSLEALWGSMFGTSLSAPESEEKMLEQCQVYQSERESPSHRHQQIPELHALPHTNNHGKLLQLEDTLAVTRLTLPADTLIPLKHLRSVDCGQILFTTATMDTLASSESALWKRMFKYYMVEEGQFLGVGPTGSFSYENKFPESGAKSLKIPNQAQSTKKAAGSGGWEGDLAIGSWILFLGSQKVQFLVHRRPLLQGCRASLLQEQLVLKLRGVLPENSQVCCSTSCSLAVLTRWASFRFRARTSGLEMNST